MVSKEAKCMVCMRSIDDGEITCKRKSCIKSLQEFEREKWKKNTPVQTQKEIEPLSELIPGATKLTDEGNKNESNTSELTDTHLAGAVL